MSSTLLTGDMTSSNILTGEYDELHHPELETAMSSTILTEEHDELWQLEPENMIKSNRSI